MKVAVVVADLAPYHAARYRESCRLLDLVVVLVESDEFVGYSKPDADDLPIVRAKRKMLVGVLEDIGPDVLVVPGWSNASAQEATLWARRRKVPVVVMSDSQLHGLRRTVAGDFIKRWLVGNYCCAFVAGRRSLQYMRHYGLPSKAIVEGVDVVDNSHFAGGWNEPGSDVVVMQREWQILSRYFLSVGRLVSQKDYYGLIAAYGIYVSKGGPGRIGLVIAGDGELRESLILYAKGLGIEAGIRFLGRVNYADLPGLYHFAEAFILNSNSNSETWGLVVNEAMASGCPVLVSSACGCVEDLVEDGVNGYSYEASSPNILADHLVNVGLGEYDLQGMGLAGRMMIARWSPRTFARALVACVEIARTKPYRARYGSQIVLGLLFRLRVARSNTVLNWIMRGPSATPPKVRP